ncbi:Structural maintenance of chromosomes protein 6 [Xylographa soralifera]|nr:Structural maintenance of chromosomes protein 6 [Xylographa soralifera]
MPALKRSRRSLYEDEEDLEEEVLGVESAQSELRQDNRKKPRLSMGLEEISDIDSSEGSTDEENEELQASQYAEKRRRKTRQQNQPAENGIIESVTCTNFMCHGYLEVAVGPLINFVIGHNGSGKSAVLTAITICLGGKASSTNRAGNLKAFIKEGQEQCVLSIKLKNAGEAGYSQDVYGKSIIVERHFNRTGTSGFKLKSASGKIISTRKADLEDISDYFALQIDNPMTILTQDMARQFLNNSTPQEKYKFFIKGVQLEQLAQDYQLLEESIDKTETTFPEKQDTIDILDNIARKAKAVFAMSEKHENIRKKVRQLRLQMAWAQVEEQEEWLASHDNEITQAKETIANVEGKVALVSDKFEQANSALEAAQIHVEDAKTELSPIIAEKETQKESYDGSKAEAKAVQTEQRRIKEMLRETERRIAKFKDDIAEEYRKLEEANGGSHARRLAELDERKAEVEAVKKRSEDHNRVLQSLEEDKIRAVQGLEGLKAPRRDKNQEIQQCNEDLQALMKDRGQQLGGYPQGMSNLIKAVRQDNSFQQPPVGPIGEYVRLLKPAWSGILEKSFGGVLNSFIVTSKQDQSKLSSMMQRCRCSFPIVIGNNSSLDFSRNEPEQNFDTAFRILAIENPIVLRQLVINQAIEQTILIENNEEARELMLKTVFPNVKQCYSFKGRGGVRLTYANQGGVNSTFVDPFSGVPRMKTDVEIQISLRRDTLKRLQGDLTELDRCYREAQNAVEECNKEIARHRRRSKELQGDIRRAESVADDLQDAIDLGAGQEGKLEALKKGLEETTEEQTILEGSYEESVLAKDKFMAQMKEFQEKMTVIDGHLAEVELKLKKAEKRSAKLIEQRHTVLQDKNSVIEALRVATEDLKELQDGRTEKVEAVTAFVEGASKVGPRVPIPPGETGKAIEKKLEKVIQDCDAYEKKFGGNTRKIAEDLAKATKEHTDALASLQEEEKLAQLLKLSLHNRRKRWERFQKLITTRARNAFVLMLAHRGHRGKLAIDHKTRLLDLIVQPDETQTSKGRQTKTLSGGEKSFSTICLLLALWEAMGAPVRCLDEFDVFMDSVNRDISMGLLIAAARGAMGRQFIFITPQGMNNADSQTDIKIIRLQDPERNQRTLEFPRE